jgi:diphthine synthase
LGELVFVGLGLFDEMGISLRGIEEVREADYIFAEFYTSLMAGFSMENFKGIVGKRVAVVSRKVL